MEGSNDTLVCVTLYRLQDVYPFAIRTRQAADDCPTLFNEHVF